METSRSKKGRKRWQLVLGLKEAIFAGIGVLGLMMMCFALGALAGRGDIYRLLHNWGFLVPAGSHTAQWTPPRAGPPAPVSLMPGTTATAAAPAPAAPKAPTTATPPVATAAARAVPPAAVTGSIAMPPAAPAPKKKAKASSLHRDQKNKEEELRRVRQEVVQKLKFQNSFDSSPKPGRVSHKPKSKAGKPSLVRVAQYRDSKAAKAKMAELQKKGIKATLKHGKDQKGPLYVIYKPAPAKAPKNDRLAQNSQGRGEVKIKRKTRTDSRSP